MAGPLAHALRAAMNTRDIDAFVPLFDPDYDSRQPAHPDRAFRGREQVRENWSAVFAGVPDFQADLLRVDAAADVAGSARGWHGHQAAGGTLEMAGVIVFGIHHGRIAWARLYVEPVEQGGG